MWGSSPILHAAVTGPSWSGPKFVGVDRNRWLRIASVVALVGAVALVSACSSSESGAQPSTSSTTPVRSDTSTTASTTTTSAAPTVIDGLLVVPGDRVVAKAAIPTEQKATEGSIATSDGRTRTYHVYVPSGLATSSAKVPLLLALHGGFGSGRQFEVNSGFDGIAAANGFIVVYPDGIGIGSDGTKIRTWNAGGCCGPSAKQNVDDVAFLKQLIDHLEQQYPIDPDRVYAAGHSNGAMMSIRLACELSNTIAAIGVQSGALEVPSCDPTRPVSVLQIHGSADANVPIGGGQGTNSISRVDYTVPIDAARTLAGAAGCSTSPTVTKDPANADISISSWRGCDGTTAIDFAEVAGANHAWMGHATGGSGAVGPPYMGLDSSISIWNFLSQHGRS